jgi:hypothetical protein
MPPVSFRSGYLNFSRENAFYLPFPQKKAGKAWEINSNPYGIYLAYMLK